MSATKKAHGCHLAGAALMLASALWLAGIACAGDTTSKHRAQRVANDNGLVKWPKAAGNEAVDQTIRVKGVFDGGMKRFYGIDDLGTNSQDEDQGALFDLADGATLQNVILGDPAADGVHCKGSCTLNNVWWERVGEDAATFRGTSETSTMVINGGGASGAQDKVFQTNAYGTMTIKNFYVELFGKLVRSCGNCKTQQKRSVIIENVIAVTGPKSKTLAGMNENYGDTAEFRGTNVIYDRYGKITPCLRYIGNSSGAEPKENGKGADGRTCRYQDANVIVRRAVQPERPASIADGTPAPSPSASPSMTPSMK